MEITAAAWARRLTKPATQCQRIQTFYQGGRECRFDRLSLPQRVTF